MEGPAAAARGSGSDRSSGGLDVVCDESGLRLGCLELFVRLTAPSPSEEDGEVEPTARKELFPRIPGFVVEEDRRQRVLVHWRSGERGLSQESILLETNVASELRLRAAGARSRPLGDAGHG
eukprot:CAMPEP_0175728704 /NCGR_PEP_ID=MMETSP0097-20121207/49433_1 /TAXON_ID=311494 /ORGANISM="Alexandrium monilatum, Strain CCMP3105" /LENGTH=121 /DNA_ID=CAMNT_0017036559 /DNA_START=106 /DNA_END=469 /DNA_ORIENTATION=+